MHNMHCFIFGPTARWAALRRPRRQPGCARSLPGREKRQRDPKKAARRGVGARCHAKVPPKDRIFGCTCSSRREDNALTCGSPEPASGSIRPTDENPILCQDFCSGAGRPRCPAAHSGRMAGQSFTTLTNARTNLLSAPKWRHSASLCAHSSRLCTLPRAPLPSLSASARRAPAMRPAPDPRATRFCAIRLHPTPRPTERPGLQTEAGRQRNALPARHGRR